MRMFNIVFLLLLFIESYSQDYDVRKTCWGMSSEQIKESEEPLIPKIEKHEIGRRGSTVFYDGKVEMIYENISIGKNRTATVTYILENNHLIKVQYRVNFNFFDSNTKVSLPDRVYAINNFFRTLEDRNFDLHPGWNDDAKLSKFKDCFGYDNVDKTDRLTVEKVEECAIKSQLDWICFKAHTNNTYVDFSFPTLTNDLCTLIFCDIYFSSLDTSDSNSGF